jgi:hypothetical protein
MSYRTPRWGEIGGHKARYDRPQKSGLLTALGGKAARGTSGEKNQRRVTKLKDWQAAKEHFAKQDPPMELRVYPRGTGWVAEVSQTGKALTSVEVPCLNIKGFWRHWNARVAANDFAPGIVGYDGKRA